MTEHVWEHLSELEIRVANVNCYKFFIKNGRLRIAVPDGFFPDITYIDYLKPGGTGPGVDSHKILLNYKSLRKLLEETGFKVILLEYWDEFGKFYIHNCDVKDGYIMRSSDDKRSQKGELRYTSLIVDAIKE